MKTIACLKWGEKYSPQYVNTLFNMCKRNCSLPFNFVCFTENEKDLNPNIKIKKLPNLPLQGWWLKPWVFSSENGFTNDVLFIDLDVVIHKSIDNLWTYMPDKFVIIRDFTRHMNPQWKRFNSSVFRFKATDHYWIWDAFQKDFKTSMSKNHGDQDYLYNILQNKAVTWPDTWIQSYKWEMRNKNDMTIINGRRNFADIKDPNVHPDNCIAVFHGEPNPHDVKDPWVINNWK